MEKLLDFLIDVGKLKKGKRRGWLIHEIPDAETTASHTFRLAFLVWLAGYPIVFSCVFLVQVRSSLFH